MKKIIIFIFVLFCTCTTTGCNRSDEYQLSDEEEALYDAIDNTNEYLKGSNLYQIYYKTEWFRTDILYEEYYLNDLTNYVHLNATEERILYKASSQNFILDFIIPYVDNRINANKVLVSIENSMYIQGRQTYIIEGNYIKGIYIDHYDSFGITYSEDILINLDNFSFIDYSSYK